MELPAVHRTKPITKDLLQQQWFHGKQQQQLVHFLTQHILMCIWTEIYPFASLYKLSEIIHAFCYIKP